MIDEEYAQILKELSEDSATRAQERRIADKKQARRSWWKDHSFDALNFLIAVAALTVAIIALFI